MCEPAPVPAHDGVGRDNLDGPAPVRPQPREQHPQHPIDVTQTRAFGGLALEDGELMPEGENLGLELEARPNGRPDGSQKGDEQRSHAGADRISPCG